MAKWLRVGEFALNETTTRQQVDKEGGPRVVNSILATSR